MSEQYEDMLAQQNRLHLALEELLRGGTRLIACEATRARLEEMADFYASTRWALEGSAVSWRARRGQHI